MLIEAAGILLIDPLRNVLFLKRGMNGDKAGNWVCPGGKIEEGESALEAACRETEEEAGFKVEPEKCAFWTRRICDGVDFTTFLYRVDAPFKPTLGPANDPENIAYAWCPPEHPPQPLHPGAWVALAKLSPEWTELKSAEAMRDGELTSPQPYENVTLFNVRITGTGKAYRHKWDEYVWRDPSLYLNDEFLARCNGLPVIMEHPQTNVLTTDEFRDRIIGVILLPYVKWEQKEVWGIAKIYDKVAAQMMAEEQLSTSPAVVWRDPDVNSEVEQRDGSKFLIEGKPSLLDHLAVCIVGVWDKGGDPTGVETNYAALDSAVDVFQSRLDSVDATWQRIDTNDLYDRLTSNRRL